MTPPKSRPVADTSPPADDLPQAPGGAAVNRAATVATSAALGGAAAGALAGAVAGPIGAAVGAAVGAVAAGVAGNAVVDQVDAEAEHHYWREHFASRPYVEDGAAYDDYGPAYGYGIESFVRHRGRRFDDAEADLSRDWTLRRGTSRLDWDRARPAARDAWERIGDRVERTLPGDADGDGR